MSVILLLEFILSCVLVASVSLPKNHINPLPDKLATFLKGETPPCPTGYKFHVYDPSCPLPICNWQIVEQITDWIGEGISYKAHMTGTITAIEKLYPVTVEWFSIVQQIDRGTYRFIYHSLMECPEEQIRTKLAQAFDLHGCVNLEELAEDEGSGSSAKYERLEPKPIEKQVTDPPSGVKNTWSEKNAFNIIIAHENFKSIYPGAKNIEVIRPCWGSTRKVTAPGTDKITEVKGRGFYMTLKVDDEVKHVGAFLKKVKRTNAKTSTVEKVLVFPFESFAGKRFIELDLPTLVTLESNASNGVLSEVAESKERVAITLGITKEELTDLKIAEHWQTNLRAPGVTADVKPGSHATLVLEVKGKKVLARRYYMPTESGVGVYSPLRYGTVLFDDKSAFLSAFFEATNYVRWEFAIIKDDTTVQLKEKILAMLLKEHKIDLPSLKFVASGKIKGSICGMKAEHVFIYNLSATDEEPNFVTIYVDGETRLTSDDVKGIVTKTTCLEPVKVGGRSRNLFQILEFTRTKYLQQKLIANSAKIFVGALRDSSVFSGLNASLDRSLTNHQLVDIDI